jgi:acetoin utilization deacetylase AcuC-like enzyme
MHVWAHDRWLFPLPEHHRYPLGKGRLLRERLIRLGICAAGDFREAEPARWSALARVHDPALLGKIRRGELSERERRGLGLPWSEALVQRARRVTNGTVMAAREALGMGVAMNLGGGSHHAGRDVARGYCLFNDIAVATDTLREAGFARMALVVDCDVHQGDGTAHLLAPTRSRSPCPCTGRATTRQSGSPPTSTSTPRAVPAIATTSPRSRRRWQPRSAPAHTTSRST